MELSQEALERTLRARGVTILEESRFDGFEIISRTASTLEQAQGRFLEVLHERRISYIFGFTYEQVQGKHRVSASAVDSRHMVVRYAFKS